MGSRFERGLYGEAKAAANGESLGTATPDTDNWQPIQTEFESPLMGLSNHDSSTSALPQGACAALVDIEGEVGTARRRSLPGSKPSSGSTPSQPT